MYVGIVVGFLNDQRIHRVALACQRFKQTQVGVDQGSVQRVELDLLEPGQPLVGEKTSLGNGDESARQYRVNPVTNAGTLMDKSRAPGGEGPVVLDGRRRYPDARQVIAAQQVGEDPGIDLVGLDVGLGDRLGFDWVGDHDVGDVGPDQSDERPGVAGDFDGEVVGGAKVLGGEAANRVRGDGKRS